jgi:tape measure domain-containing protein
MADNLSVEIDVDKANAALGKLSTSSDQLVSKLGALGNVDSLTKLNSALNSMPPTSLSQVAAGINNLNSSMGRLSTDAISAVNASLSQLAGANTAQAAQGISNIAAAANSLGGSTAGIQSLGSAVTGLHAPTDVAGLNFNKLSSQIKQSISEMSGMSSTSTQMAAMLYQANLNLNAMSEGFSKATGNSIGLSKALLTLAVANVIKEVAVAAGELIRPFYEAATAVNSFKTALDASLGSGAGAKGFAELREIANSTGGSIQAMSKNFSSFKISAEGANLSAAVTAQTFKGFSTAFTALGVSTQGQELSFRALSQMMSKGKITAEELKGQLGEQMPNAMGTFAKAMGMSTAGFEKMLSTGNVVAAELLPKVGAALLKDYSGGLSAQLVKLPAQLNIFSNGLMEVQAAIGNGNILGILDPLANGLRLINDALNTEGLRYAAGAISDLVGVFLNLASVVGGGLISGFLGFFAALGAIAQMVGSALRSMVEFAVSLVTVGDATKNTSTFFGVLTGTFSTLLGYVSQAVGVFGGLLASLAAGAAGVAVLTAAYRGLAFIIGLTNPLILAAGIVIGATVFVVKAATEAKKALTAETEKLAAASSTGAQTSAVYAGAIKNIETAAKSGAGELAALGESHRSMAAMTTESARTIRLMEEAVKNNERALKSNAASEREAEVRQRDLIRAFEDEETALKRSTKENSERAKTVTLTTKELTSYADANTKAINTTNAATKATAESTAHLNGASGAASRNASALSGMGSSAVSAGASTAQLSTGMGVAASNSIALAEGTRRARTATEELSDAKKNVIRDFEDARSRNDSYRDSLGTMAEKLKSAKDEMEKFGYILDNSTRALTTNLVAGGLSEKQAGTYAAAIARLMDTEKAREDAGKDRVARLKEETMSLGEAVRGTAEALDAEQKFLDAKLKSGQLSAEQHKVMQKTLDLERDTVKSVNDMRTAKIQEAAAVQALTIWRKGDMSLNEAALEVAKHMKAAGEGEVDVQKAVADATKMSTETKTAAAAASDTLKTAKEKEADAIKKAVGESTRATESAKQASEAMAQTAPALADSSAGWGKLNTALAQVATSSATTATSLGLITESITAMSTTLPLIPEAANNVSEAFKTLSIVSLEVEAVATPLAAALTSAAAALAPMATSVPLIVEGFKGLTEPMSGATDEFERLNETAPSVSLSFEKLSTSFTAISTALPAMVPGLVGTADQIDRISEKADAFAGVVSSVNNLGSALGTLADAAIKNAEPFATLATNLGLVAISLEGGGPKADVFGDRLAALRAKVAELTTSLNEMKTAADAALEASGKAGGSTSGSVDGGVNAGSGRMGGLSGGLPQSVAVSGSAFSSAPQLAAGTANTSKLVSGAVGGGGIPTILHPNEAVIPLTKGRSVPVELTSMVPQKMAPDSAGSIERSAAETARLIASSLDFSAQRAAPVETTPVVNTFRPSASEIFRQRGAVDGGSEFGDTNASTDGDVTSKDAAGGRDRPIVVNLNISATDVDSFRRSKTQIQAEMYEAMRRAHSRNN